MSLIHKEIFEILFFFVIFTAASVLTYALRARLRQDALPQHAAKALDVKPVNVLALFFGPFSRSGMVLLLSVTVTDLLSAVPWLPDGLRVEPLLLKGWMVGWFALFLFGFTEGMARAIFHLRHKPFPVDNLLLSLARAVYLVGIIFLVMHSVLKMNISPLLTSTAIMSAAVGLALKEVLVDLLDGMIMHFSRTIMPADWVAFNNIEGEVLSTSWHETRIRNNDGHVFVVPNSLIARTQVHNMTWPDPRRRHTMLFPVSYAESVETVVAALVAATKEDQDVLPSPPPEAFIHEFQDHGVVYKLRFWSNRYFDRAAFQGRIANRVWYQFKRQRIEIPIPVSGKALFHLLERERRKDQDPSAEACLVNSSFFKQFIVNPEGEPLLEREQLGHFADALHKRVFGAGEVVFRQGEPGRACFILLEGRLNCRVVFGENGNHSDYELKPGTLFGEISLVTGLPRTATVTALEESHLLEISQRSLARLFELNESLPGEIAHLAADRLARSSEDYQRMEGVTSDQAKSAAMHPENILQRLRRISLWEWGSKKG